MTLIRLLRLFVVRGLIASAIACVIGVGYALFTHSPVTNVTIATANLWIFIAMLGLAGLTGNVDMKARQQRVDRAVLTTSRWNSKDDYDHMESSVSFAIMFAISSIIPLLIWAITYYVF